MGRRISGMVPTNSRFTEGPTNMTRRLLTAALLTLLAGLTPERAAAGVLLTASPSSPDGTVLSVGQSLTIDLHVDPTAIADLSAPPGQADAVELFIYASLDLADGLVFDSITGVPTPASPDLQILSYLVAGGPPHADPSETFSLELAIRYSLSIPVPASISPFVLSLTFQAVAPSIGPDPITFYAEAISQFRNEDGVVDHTQVTVPITPITFSVGSSTVPEPSGLVMGTLLLGLFGMQRVIRRAKDT